MNRALEKKGWYFVAINDFFDLNVCSDSERWD